MSKKTGHIHYGPNGKFSTCGSTADPEKLTDNIGLVTCTRCLKTRVGIDALSELKSDHAKPEVVEITPSTQQVPIDFFISERNAFELTKELKTLQDEYFNQIAKSTIDSDGRLDRETLWVIQSLLGTSQYDEFLAWFEGNR